DRPIVSTDGSKVSTDEQVEGTEEHNEGAKEIFEGTEEQREGTEEKNESTKEKNESTGGQIEGTKYIFGDDETIATLLLNMSQAKAASKEKEKGVELREIHPKDKGKKKIEEEDESKTEEVRNKIAEEEATNEALIKNFDAIKARIEADKILTEKLQEQEREQFTIEERAKFLHDTITAQRKFLAQQRSEAIRNRPPTKNQLRNQMMTYLKHVGNFKHSELKSKKSVEDDRLIKRMNKKDSYKGEEIKQESKKKSRKRIKEKRIQERESTYKEKDELRLCLTIAPDEDKEVDYEILDKKYPIIDWKTENLGTKPQFDESKRSEEINMKFMFNPENQESFGTQQHEWKVVSWKLRSSSGVHTLMTDEGLVVHMLIEKKYPLKKEILMQMLKLKLESEEDRFSTHLPHGEEYGKSKINSSCKDYTNQMILKEKVRAVAYKLELLQELSEVHNTFHVSNLKNCRANEPLAIPLDGIHIDDKLHFVEEPVVIMDRDIKRLKQSRIPIVKESIRSNAPNPYSPLSTHFGGVTTVTDGNPSSVNIKQHCGRLQIKQDDNRISICQEQYTRNLLKKYEISDSSSVKTPMVLPNNLGLDLASKPVNEILYSGMIGSLMYLTATRPDIQFSMC
ncbi:hypothetical protein Tco_0200550, partial [Tanacetum coccineum]